MQLIVIIAVSSAGIACVIATSAILPRGRSLPRWIFAGGLIILACEAVFQGLSLVQSSPIDALFFQRWRHGALALAPCVWLAFALTYARANTAVLLDRWWLGTSGLVIFSLVLLTFNNNGLFTDLDLDDSGRLTGLHLGWTGYVIHLSVVIGSVVILMHLERTFRASVGRIRWRIKFMLMGTALVWAVLLYTSSQALVFRAIDISIQGINGIGLILGCLLMTRSLFRTGHFETDLYPSSSMVLGSVTLLLAGIYLFAVGIMAKVVSFLGGESGFTLKALLIMVGLVAITLAVQSDRVRVVTRQFASRHFQRPLHDYRSIWQQATDATAKAETSVELSKLAVELISKVFEAHSIAFWTYVDDDSAPVLRKTASTGQTRTTLSSVDSDLIEGTGILQQYRAAKAPFSFESSIQPWATILREKTPRQFPEYRAPRIAMPLSVQGEFLGLLTIGDRIAGIPFNTQDLEILQSVGHQIAARLLNLQLSRQMADAREVEAFRSMATFFIHDLKNAISGLRLMARNLEIQFENPKFREDAVRAITKSVDRIEGLIQRMTQLRRQLQINPIPSDLNALVVETLKRVGNLPGTNVVTDLGDVKSVDLDREQIISVLTNLVINASQASSDGVEIRIFTKQADDEISLTVEDDGPGMDEDFLRHRLFRPFQSTKSHGMGIGLFQCKAIVEAHGGRMTVKSIVGQGTTVRISLPTVGNELLPSQRLHDRYRTK